MAKNKKSKSNQDRKKAAPVAGDAALEAAGHGSDAAGAAETGHGDDGGAQAGAAPHAATAEPEPAPQSGQQPETTAQPAKPGMLVVVTAVLAGLALVASVIAIVAVVADQDRGDRDKDRLASEDAAEDYEYYDEYEDCLDHADDKSDCIDHQDRHNELESLADMIDEFAQYYREDMDPETREQLRSQVLEGMDELLTWFFPGSRWSQDEWTPFGPDADSPDADRWGVFGPEGELGRFRGGPVDESRKWFFFGRGDGHRGDGPPEDGLGSWLWFDAWSDPGTAERSFGEFNTCLRDHSATLRDFFRGRGGGPDASTRTTQAPDSLADLRDQTTKELAEIESAFKACEDFLPDAARAWMDIDRGFFSDIVSPHGKAVYGKAVWSPLKRV